jgi:hypothetical protein
MQEKLYEEQVEAFKKLPGPLSMEHFEHMPLLHACVRETLRLRPPIMAIMRRVKKEVVIEAEGRRYVIPKGAQVGSCISTPRCPAIASPCVCSLSSARRLLALRQPHGQRPAAGGVGRPSHL